MRSGLVVIALVSMVWCHAASACGPQVRITYAESSPDYFRVEFINGPNFELREVRLDLSGSVGRAHIDTAYGAAPSANADGVQLVKVEDVVERGRTATLTFKNFFAGRDFRYLVDLDDESPAGGGDFDHLTASEISGATAVARLVHSDGRIDVISGQFNKDSVAVLAPKACV